MIYPYGNLHLEARWAKMRLAQRFTQEQTPTPQDYYKVSARIMFDSAARYNSMERSQTFASKSETFAQAVT